MRGWCFALMMGVSVGAMGQELPVLHGPAIKAESAAIIDADTGKILWTKNATTSRFPASTTKIMTALLLLEHTSPDDLIAAPADVEKVKEASLHLKPGETLKAKDLLYAIMLRSANDACYVAAVHIAGSVSKFADMMNERAKKIGCRNTHFHNPNGLMDSEHTTCAYDLAIIAAEAMKLPTFRAVAKTYKKEISRSINWQDTVMTNHNRFLPLDPTVEGIKTGYTKPAGNCFVGSSNHDGFRIIATLLKSDRQSWMNDYRSMVEWAYKNFERVPALPDGSLGSVKIDDGAESVEVRAANPIVIPRRKGLSNPPSFTLSPSPSLHAPVKQGDVVGTVRIADSDGLILSSPVVAMQDVAPKPLAAIPDGLGKLIAMMVGAVVVMVVAMRIPWRALVPRRESPPTPEA